MTNQVISNEEICNLNDPLIFYQFNHHKLCSFSIFPSLIDAYHRYICVGMYQNTSSSPDQSPVIQFLLITWIKN